MKINYICEWHKNKVKSWSGTTLSLYNALNKRENVLDLGFRLNIVEKIAIKLSSLNVTLKGINFENRLNILSRYIPKLHAISNAKKIESSDVILQIGDIAKYRGSYYIYQDLSIDSLIYMSKYNQTAFKFSNYQNISESTLYKRNKWQKDIYKNAAGIFTMSNWLKENLIDYSGIDHNKIHHVGGGINIDPQKINPIKKYSNKILFVGRDFKRKAGYLVYDSFKILKEKYLKEAELYIIGPSENPLDDSLEGVNFIGDTSYSELSKYFNMCDIFCMPSYFEAYGLVFIEALAYGLPCIGRDDFAMKEFIKDGYNGYLIESNDANELAEKMFSLLINQTIKDNVLNDKEFYLNEYTWDAVAERIIKVLEADINGK